MPKGKIRAPEQIEAILRRIEVGYRHFSSGMAGSCGRRDPLHRAWHPWQNGIKEGFNGHFRNECPDRVPNANVLEAASVAFAFKEDCSDIRSRGTIDYRSPNRYRADLLNQGPGGGKTRLGGPDRSLELAVVPTNKHN